MTNESISSKQIILLDHFFSDSVPLPNVLLQLTLDYIYPRHLTEIQNYDEKCWLRCGVALFGKTLGYEIRISNTEKSHVLSSFGIDLYNLAEQSYHHFCENISEMIQGWSFCCIRGDGCDPFAKGEYCYRYALCPHDEMTYELQCVNYCMRTEPRPYYEIRILQLMKHGYSSQYHVAHIPNLGYKHIGYFGFTDQLLSNLATAHQYVQQYGCEWKSYPLNDFVAVNIIENGTHCVLKS